MSNIQQNLEKILSSRYGRDVRQAIHDGIHNCYEDGKAGAIDLTARELIQQKMSGSPHGAYPTLAALQTAKPSGDTGIYVVSADGKWYYWSGSAWTEGGVYQSTALTSADITSRIGGTGEVKYADPTPVVIDSTLKEVTFPSYSGSNARLVVNGMVYAVPQENAKIQLGAVTTGRLFFNTQTLTFRVGALNTTGVNPYEYLVMIFRFLEPKMIVFNGQYILDGWLNNKPPQVSEPGEVKVVSNGVANIDSALRRVDLPSAFGDRTWLFTKIECYELAAENSSITLPTESYGNVVRVCYNTQSQSLVGYRWTDPMQEYDHLVMAINFLSAVPDVQYNGAYTIDDKSATDQIAAEVEDKLSLELLRYNLEDCITSWWAYPLAKRHIGHRDKTYLCYTDSQGYTGVASIDNRSGAVVKKRLKKRDIDDHNAGALDILDDGRIMAVYASGHNQDNFMTVRISSKIESVEEFDEEIKVLASGTTTYAQVHRKNGKYFVFFRTANQNWSYMTSVDGLEWTTPVKFLIAGMQYYCKVVDTTDANLLRIVMYSNPNETDYSFRLGFFDTSTNQLKLADGTVVGTADISKDSFPVFLPAGASKQRLLDVAVTAPGLTLLAYATFTKPEAIHDPSTDVMYRIARYDGTLHTVDLVAGGYPFYFASTYVGGVVFGYDTDTVFVSRQEGNTRVWKIEKWTTADQLTWQLSETLHTTAQYSVAIRPVIEVGGDKVIWQEGYYSPYSFTDTNVDLEHRKVRDL